jgi:hypothetical protein
MHEAERLSLEAIGRFVEASEGIGVEGVNRQGLYGWAERLLVQHEPGPLQSKAARGLVRRYVAKMTGLSRGAANAADCPLHSQRAGPAIRLPSAQLRQRYTRADIELLASVDEAHETLSGPATRRILEREVELFGRQEYARLARITVTHLNNLRGSQR